MGAGPLEETHKLKVQYMRGISRYVSAATRGSPRRKWPWSPFGIGLLCGVIRVFIVPGGIPLLISNEFLTAVEAVLELESMTVDLRALGIKVNLQDKSSPHMTIGLSDFGPPESQVPEGVEPRLSEKNNVWRTRHANKATTLGVQAALVRDENHHAESTHHQRRQGE